MDLMKYSLCLGLFILLVSQNFAQDTLDVNTEEKLEAILKVKEGNIHLRWAPTTPGLWLKMQRGSFIVQKQSWAKGEFDVDAPLSIISDTLKVWPQSTFEQLDATDQSNEYLMLAGYCMHAPYESIREKGMSLESLINREQELTNRFSSALFAADRNRKAAQAMALSFTDTDVDLNKNHAYHIILITEEKKVYQTFTIYNPNYSYSFTPTITKTAEKEEMVVLSWDKASHAAHYSSYWIERSTDNIHFSKLNEVPYVHAFDANLPSHDDDFVYIDSVENYIPYYYRIVGLDAFGDESTPSESIKLMGKDKTPPAVVDAAKAEMYLDQFMQITWQHHTQDIDLAGFYLKKSPLREGPFVSCSPLLDVTERSFKDLAPNYLSTNFYQVCAVDTAQNVACSYPIYGLIRDTIPPLKPTGLKGKIDSSGVVTLNWDAGKELDLKGYNIYFANKWNRVFTILNEKPIYTNQYIDTVNLNSLTEDIYYRIVAMDVRDNLSSFSDMVQLFKPDTIPPGPSIFTEFVSKNEKITLKWAPSSSKDVVQQLLLKSVNGNAFNVIQKLDKSTNSYSDQDLKPNEKYQYRILAIDDSGLESESVNDLTVMSPISESANEVVLMTLKDDGNYILSCTLSNTLKKEGKLIIYTQEGDGPFITWKSLKMNDQNLKIPIPNEDKRKYKARFIQSSGHKSDFSKIVSL